jgi:signal transduction histidine kinase
MRRPVQIQLLLPTLSVVVLAIVLASGASAYVGAARARQAQEDSLSRVVDTLSEAKFPLSEPVLRQMSGLSGAEFIFVDENHRVRAATLPPSADELRRLEQWPSNPVPAGTASGLWATRPGIELGGRMYLIRRVPISGRGPDPVPGSLVVLYSEALWSAAMRQAAYPALLAGAIAVLAVVLVNTVLAQRFVRPIRRLCAQTAAFARGEFSPVAVGPRDDELRDLALAINRMTERLSQYEREVRRSEQLRTLGQLGAGMAHQLRNAATGGRMAIELHQRECRVPAGNESLEVALRQLRLMESYVQRFLTLSRPRPACRETVSLAALIDDVCTLVRPACLHAGIELSVTKPAEPLAVAGDPEDLRQLAVNLVLNAVDAVRGHDRAPATITIRLEPLGGDRAALSIEDSGPGPAPSVADRLFEPFVTEKPEGTGLGLFVARQIAEDHQGSIRWQRVGGLTQFIVELPLR